MARRVTLRPIRASVGIPVAFLTMIVHGREARRFVLKPTTTSIGRSHDNDIVINNLALSRYHAEVQWLHGRYEVKDLGSQNGVYVNNSRIWTAHPLSHTDLITLGTYHFIFHAREDTDDSHAPDEGVTTEERVPLLVVKYNDVELQRLPVRGAECLIGRARECDIQIAERRLSRRHCKIFHEHDRHAVADLGSHNGTYVNRRRISGPCPLHHGDVLNFAEYSVHFLEDAAKYDGPDRVHPGPPDGPESPFEDEHTPSRVPRNGRSRAASPRMSAPSLSPDTVPPAEDGRPTEPGSRRAPVTKVLDPRVVDPAAPLGERPPPSGAEQSLPRSDRRAAGASPVPRDPEPKGAVGRGGPPHEPGSRDPPGGGPEGRPPASEVEQSIEGDVPDRGREIRPERALDDWYRQREDSDVHAVESSVLLEPRTSSMSHVLATMMVNKGELDRHLRTRTRKRGFAVRVEAHGRVMYDGPLESQVTILGTDDEADLHLVGRYVAGRHSLLVRVRDSLLLVRLGSSSAARVNGLPKLQAFLRPGDIIQIDETTIEVREG